VLARDRAWRAHSRRDHRVRALRGGAVPADWPVVEVEGDGRGEHRHGAAVMPGKEGAGRAQ
jgi:hypothetical protein